MKYLLTFLFLFIQLVAFSQGKQILQEGDTLSNYQVKLVSNGKFVDTKDLIAGRKLVLYFWGRRCVPCVKSLPKLDSIQTRFGDQVLVLCVSAEQDEKEVQDFLASKPLLSKLSLTFVTDGTLKIFRGFKTSNVCWFDNKQILRVITSSAATNQKNIDNWLKGVTALINN